MIYYSLLIRKKSSITIETSFHVVSLQFDNYVDNKLFTFHEFITHSLIHVLILLSNKSLMYTTRAHARGQYDEEMLCEVVEYY